MCAVTNKIPTDYTCPEGILKGKWCEVDVVSQPIISCPKHFELLGNICQRTETLPPDISCEKGYGYVNGRCIATEKIPALQTCADGSLEGGKHCITKELIPPQRKCDDGFNFSDGGCHKTHTKDVALECGKGFKLEDHQCVGISKEKATVAVCPHKTEAIPAELFCKKGTLDPSGSCIVSATEPPDAICPAGYKVFNGHCGRKIPVPAQMICPNGGIEKHGGCEEVLVSAPEMSCPKGYVLGMEGQCVRSQLKPYSLECPDGYKLHNGVCMPKVHTFYLQGGTPEVGEAKKIRGHKEPLMY